LLQARQPGGVYIGLGTNQNYSLIPWARPDAIVFLDYDEVIVNVHRLNGVFLKSAKSPWDFLLRWSKKNRQKAIKLIRQEYSKDQALASALVKLLNWRGLYMQYEYMLDRKRMAARGVKMYLTDQGFYDTLKAYYVDGKVVYLRGNLLLKGAVEKLGKKLKENGAKVSVYFPSNAETYFMFIKHYKENIASLPFANDATVIRTRAWARYIQALPEELKVPAASTAIAEKKINHAASNSKAETTKAEGKKKIIFYTYASQSAQDFVNWLGDPKTTHINQFLPYGSTYDNGYYKIKPHRPKVIPLQKGK
jgi:hypothetical protein